MFRRFTQASQVNASFPGRIDVTPTPGSIPRHQAVATHSTGKVDLRRPGKRYLLLSVSRRYLIS